MLTAPDAKPVVIIDGAHNPDGAKVLRDAMKTFCPSQRTLMVTGMLADKDTTGILRSFRDITTDFIATEPVNPRSMTKEALKDALQAQGARCLELLEPEAAVEEALRRKEDYDVILFAGSLYLIGQIRGMLREAVR